MWSVLPVAMMATAMVPGSVPEVSLTGDFQVKVSAGEVKIAGKTVSIATPITLTVAPPARLRVTDERYDTLLPFDEKAPGWKRGNRLKALITYETSAPDLLLPDSVRLKTAAGPNAPTLTKGTDYTMDPRWASVGKLPGASAANGPVWADYETGLGRIDSIVVDSKGKVSLRQGTPHNATPHAPELSENETLLANIWVPGNLARLTPDNLYPVLEAKYTPPARTANAATLLPKTWQKLNNGETVRILAWGDSVTTGAQASDVAHHWQEQFVTRLRRRFPNAKIELTTVAWGGRNTDSFLKEPPGSPYNFEEKVVGAKPDLIAMEFVNDASLSPAAVEERYSKILARFQSVGAEWAILTPHFVWGEWMGTGQKKVEKDPRPYVAGLREFTAKHNVALADASRHWEHLVKEGIPYQTLLCNSLNHPNDFGHKLFADALMDLFGEK
jgi:lysophospholipase L1-like esterase